MQKQNKSQVIVGCALGLVLSVLLLAAPRAGAQVAIGDALERRCWQSYTPERTSVDLRDPFVVSFTNLRNGYQVRSPFWVEFGVRGMGVVPAGTAHDKAGHHHLLIDKALPRDYREKIPFDDKHRHFGKGQTGTLLDLPPGPHTLRLLFADHEHRPHFVFSPEITVTVIGKRIDAAPRIDEGNFQATCAAWYQDTITTPRTAAKAVYIKNLRDDDEVGSPVRLSLGTIGWGVAPADRNVKDTGYFAISVLQSGRVVARYDWKDGRTEGVIDLPRGRVALQVLLLSAAGQSLQTSEQIGVRVVRGGQ